MRPAVTEVIAHPDQAKSIASIMDDYQYKQTKLNKLPLKSGEEQEVVDASPRARNPDLWQDHLRYLEQIKTKSSKGSAKAAELKPPKFEVSQ